MEDSQKVTSSDKWAEAIEKIKRKMSYAQILVEAALIINADDTIRRMQRTNNRIYVAL
jgi:vacuolar-type H+-ATPase subunit F/Vma7